MEEMPIAEAQKLGAMALFGEKYGETVRVVTMGDGDETASIEFCGGTHLDNTSRIGLFKIISESSVASGVRRIEAVTGRGVLELVEERAATIQQAAESLKLANPLDIVKRCHMDRAVFHCPDPLDQPDHGYTGCHGVRWRTYSGQIYERSAGKENR